MNEASASGRPPATPLGVEFYVTGGTLRPDAPSYVERQADKDLCEGLLQGEFCYVLTSRQMGKSSLMVRTVRRLRQEGVAVAVLDLTAIGQNLTLEQWYDGLTARLGQQLGLEDELLEFREAHREWGPLQRWVSAIEMVVLHRVSGKVVIFIDEIDLVRSLPFSTDEFFAAIRECYNRRAREPLFCRLAFGLLGVAAPTDLIRDTRMTPFNVGRRIELHDFTGAEAAPLARGLSADDASNRSVLAQVLYWTGGHPYLTQRLCRALAETLFRPSPDSATGRPVPPVLPTPKTVDQLAHQLFLARQARDRDDNLIFVRERILRSETDVPGLLYLYRKILTGQPVADDETNPLISILRLSGITRNRDGYLEVRNRIYWQVFDLAWVLTNMPEAEVRRQRRASRRGMLVGFGIAVVLLLAYLVLGPIASRYRNARLAHRTIQDVAKTYRETRSYRDIFESTFEIGLGGTTVTAEGSGSMLFEGPNKVRLDMKSGLHEPQLEVRFVSDGTEAWVYVPSLQQYQGLETPPTPAPFDMSPPLQQMGPMRVLPVYRLLLDPAAADRFLGDARNVQYGGSSQLNGQPVRLIKWEHEPSAFLAGLGLTNAPADRTPVPITAWVGASNRLVLQVRMDLSHWASQLMRHSTELPATSLIVTESHQSIQTAALPTSSNRFTLVVPAEARLVDQLELPALNVLRLASSKRQFSKLIPPRLAEAPPNLVDLSDYYNAALVQTWHPSVVPQYTTNSLDVLPSGLLQLGGVTFDVRGIVQLSGLELQKVGGQFPRQITGIKINRTCHQLHFLQATGWRVPVGTAVGSYRVHYVTGEEQVIPIVYGEDVRDWNADSDPSTELTRSTVVWSGMNKSRVIVRLFKTDWVNPLPETEIVSIDYISTMADAARFLIALTATR